MVTFCGSPAANGSPHPAVLYGSRLRYKSPFTWTRFAGILRFPSSMEDFAHVLSSHRCMERLRSCAYAGERACGYAPQGNRPEHPEGWCCRDPCDKGDELEVPRQSGESSDTPKAPPAPVRKEAQDQKSAPHAPQAPPAPRQATTPGGRAPGYAFTPPVSTPGWTTLPKTGLPRTGRPEGPERPPAPKQAKADEAAPSSPEPAQASTPPPASRPPRPAPSLPIDDVIDQGPARHRARRGWFGRRKRYRHIAVLLPLILVAASFAVSFDQRGARNGEGNGPFTLSITADRPTGGDARQNENAAMPEDVALMGVQDELVPRNDAVTPVVPGRPIPRTPAPDPVPEPQPGPDHPIPNPVPTPPGPDPDPVPRIPDPDPIPEPPLPPKPDPEPEPPAPPAPPEPPNPLPPIPVPKPPEPTPEPEPPKPPQTPPGLPLPLPLPTAIPLPPLPLPLPIPLPTQLPLPL